MRSLYLRGLSLSGYGRIGIRSRNDATYVFLLGLSEQDCGILLPRRAGRDVSVSLVLLYGFFKLISRYNQAQLNNREIALLKTWKQKLTIG